MPVHLFQSLAGAMPASRRMERKFFVAPAQVGVALGLLRQVCRPDDGCPNGLVNSLYFDTFDLEEYHRSQSGDFAKDKVRVRWYGEPDPPDDTRSIFFELKSKQGFVGTKRRLKLRVPARYLAPPRVARGIVPRVVLNSALATLAHFPTKPLYPVVRVSYWRYRFVEPLTGQRVALDCRIRSSMVGPWPHIGERELELAGAVIEIKGTKIELPATLRRVGVLDVDWSHFSKYSACVDAHDERPGAVGRLSPSGRVLW